LLFEKNDAHVTRLEANLDAETAQAILINDKSVRDLGTLLKTSPSLCCRHTSANDEAFGLQMVEYVSQKSKASSFECLEAVAEMHLRNLVLAFVHVGSYEVAVFTNEIVRLYQKVEQTCTTLYNAEKAELYAASERLFHLAPGQKHHLLYKAYLSQFAKDRPPWEVIGNAESDAQVQAFVPKKFGIVTACDQNSFQHCRLTVSMWNCYAKRHTNTDLYYEFAYDYEDHLPKVCTYSPHLINSTLCRLVYDGILTRWRAKPRASLHAFGSYKWILSVDAADTAIGPGCSSVSLDRIIEAAETENSSDGPHVIVKDPSDFEDSNGGVYMFRGNTKWGRLFVDLVNDKDNWPGETMGGGCYPEQMSMNEALLEMVALETGKIYNSDCLHLIFITPDETTNVFGCQFTKHLMCFRRHLERMAGPFGARKTGRIVKFLNPRIADINYRPYGNVAGDGSNLGSIRQNSPFLWHWVNYPHKKRVLADHLALADVIDRNALQNMLYPHGSRPPDVVPTPEEIEADKKKAEKMAQSGSDKLQPQAQLSNEEQFTLYNFCEALNANTDRFGCGLGSAGNVCQHLPHRYITQC